jgi:transcription elongation factor Elf1
MTERDHFDLDILGAPEKAEPKFGLKSFTCPACGAEFGSSSTLSIHMVTIRPRSQEKVCLKLCLDF